MATGTATLDTNSLDATGAEVTLTTETLITLYVVAKTGVNHNHCVILQASPDSGTTWVPIPPPVLGIGVLTVEVAATKVRAKVLKAEGATSTVTVHILAR